MNGLYTLDASVFVSAFNDYESAHAESRRVVDWVRQYSIPLVEPTLLLPEITAAIARVYQNESLALSFAENIRRIMHITFAALDADLADIAVDIAAHHRLRGSDAVYVAVAQRFDATLITLDEEQRRRVAAAISVRSPGEMAAERGLDEA